MAPLVGRSRELGVLRDALDEARSGHTRLVLVTGEAGMGKTRLVEELVEHARASGCRTVWGRAWEGGGAPEYWPWIEVLRSLGHERSVGELDTARSSADDAGARFRLFDRIAGALREGSDVPTVVALDDLHIADEPTIRLTQFLARSVRDAPILLVGMHRDEQREGIVDLGREGTIIRLSALTEVEVQALVDVDHTLGARIAEVSGGNPFFASELARLWSTAADRAVPSGIREVIRRRVDALPSRTAELLRMAAVIGRSFDVDVLARAAEADLADALDRLVPAADSNLARIEEGHRWRFVHDLVRAALVDELDPSARARHHLAVVDALDIVVGTPPAVMAHHCWEAVPAIDPARAERWLVAAAEHAGATLAYEDAANHWRRASELVDDAATRWTHLMRCGEALRLAGSWAEAQQVCRAACDIALALGDPERFAQAALGVAGYAENTSPLDRIALLEQALRLLPVTDSAARALVMSNHAAYLANTARCEEAVVTSGDALAMARRVGDDLALAIALFNHHYLLIMDASTLPTRLELASELLALTDRLDDTERRVNALQWYAHDLLEQGDIAAMERQLARGNAMAEAARLRFGMWGTTYPGAFLALLRGELDLAERIGAEAFEAGSATGFGDVNGVNLTFLFHLRRAQGRLAELTESVPADAPGGVAFGSVESALALAFAELGLPDAARQLVHEVLARGYRSQQRQAINLALAEAVVLIGDEEAARPLYDELLPYRGRVVPSLICGAPHGAVDRVLGGLASVLGDDAAAERHLAAGRALNEALGFRLWLTASSPTTLPQGRSSRVNRDGEYWTFEHGGVTSRLKDSPGVRHLTTLLLAPGREHHALDLTGSTGVDDGRSGALLDARAKEQYRRRLTDLQDEIDDASAANDLGRAEQARVELDALVDHLTAAVGLGGRDRLGATATERARQSVTRAIKRAVDRVADADPALGAHLRATVRTGIYSSYTPDPAAPVTWTS